MFARHTRPPSTPRYRPEPYTANDSGMDIDPPNHSPSPLSRWAVSAGYEQNEPARKRPHREVATVPFQAHPHAPVHQYSSNTPFIFHSLQAVPPAVPELPPFSSYDASAWKGMTMSDFATLPPARSAPIPEVEMEDSGGPSTLFRQPEVCPSGVGETKGQAVPEPIASQPVREERAAKVEDDQEEVERSERKIAKGALTREKRRREREWKRRYSGSDGEDEYEQSRMIPAKTEHTYHHHHNVNAPGMRHSEVPAMLLGYLQFFVNASVVFFVLYLAVMLVLTVKRDVNDRMAEASIELMQEISECSNLYLTNRCDPTVRVPAMESACKTWEICMKRDPTMIGRTNVMVETFAGVINSFVEQISWRTMGFTLVTLSFMVTFANSALFNLRQSASHDSSSHAGINSNAYRPDPQHLAWLQHQQHAFQQQRHQGGMLPNLQQSSGVDGIRQIGWEAPKKKGWLW